MNTRDIHYTSDISDAVDKAITTGDFLRLSEALRNATNSTSEQARERTRDIHDSGAKIGETKVSLKPQLKLFEFLFENLG